MSDDKVPTCPLGDRQLLRAYRDTSAGLELTDGLRNVQRVTIAADRERVQRFVIKYGDADVVDSFLHTFNYACLAVDTARQRR